MQQPADSPGSEPPRVGVIWCPYKAKSLWGTVAGATTDPLWLPALVREQELVRLEATGTVSIDEVHLFLGSLVSFEGAAPGLGVRLPEMGQLVRVLDHVARLRGWVSLEAGTLSLVPTLVGDFGLRLARQALAAAMRILPGSAPLRHDALVVSWRMVEILGPEGGRATVADILRLYPPDWTEPLAFERVELVWLILLAALRAAGHLDEASRFYESTVGPGVKSDRALDCLTGLLAGGLGQQPKAGLLLGEGAGRYVEPGDVRTVVLLNPPRPLRMPARLRKGTRTQGGS